MRCSLLLLGLLGLLSSCDSKECTLLGCESSATIRMFANIPRDKMEGATITACRNNSCSSGRPATVPAAPNDRIQLGMNGSIAVLGYLTTRDPVKGYAVEATFPLDGVLAQNGDLYELRVTNAGETTPVVAASDKATYKETQPNGSECPPVCRNATIEK